MLGRRPAQAASTHWFRICTWCHRPPRLAHTLTDRCVCNVRETSEWRSSSRSHTHTWSRNTCARLPTFARPPLPPFMWNGSLPADKSIGFALSTPTCDNERLYRQPGGWNNAAAVQLKAKCSPVMADEQRLRLPLVSQKKKKKNRFGSILSINNNQ